MIDKENWPDIEQDAIDYFNNSVYSSSHQAIFKSDVFNTILIGFNRFDEYDHNLYIKFKRSWNKIYHLREDNKMSLDEMKEFLSIAQLIIDFVGKEDKMIEINKRKKEMEKDFIKEPQK